MPKTVSTYEAQNTLSALIGWVREHRDEVIVENHGKPAAVLVAFDEYEDLRALKEQQRRKVVLEKMRHLQIAVSARNTDLNQDEIDALADELTRDAITTLEPV